MTEAAVNGATPAPATRSAQFVHGGVYELWRTPAGGLLVRFRRDRGFDPELGQVREIENAPEERLPEMPPAMVAMLDQSAATGEPPSLKQMLRTAGVMLRGGGLDAMPEAVTDGTG